MSGKSDGNFSGPSVTGVSTSPAFPPVTARFVSVTELLLPTPSVWLVAVIVLLVPAVSVAGLLRFPKLCSNCERLLITPWVSLFFAAIIAASRCACSCCVMLASVCPAVLVCCVLLADPVLFATDWEAFCKGCPVCWL